MASSNPPKVSALQKIVQKHLECGICYEQYNDPRVLDCQHSFCKTCLQNYQSTNYKDATMLICPVCLKKTQLHQKDVQALKTNFNITRLADQLKLVSSSEDNQWVCKLCKDKNEATHFCFDCPAIFCANCYQVHQKSHTVNTLKDISDGKIASKDRKRKRRPECQTHEGEVMWFFCTTCDVMICQVCTVIDHCKPQHEYIDSNQSSSTYKQSLAQLFTPLEETMKKLEQSQATASPMKDNLNIAAKRTMADLKNRADEIRAEVTAQESRIMDEIQTTLKDRNRKLEEFEQAVSVHLQQIQQSLQSAKDVSKSSLAPDFLAVYSTISQDLKKLRDKNQPKIDPTLDHMGFTSGVCDISLGNLKGSRWELCLKYGERFDRAMDIDASLPGDEIAVAVLGNRRVVIYDTTGHQKKTIKLPQGPLSVAAFKNQLVIADNTNSVKMYNRNGNKMFEFHTVPHSEVNMTPVRLCSVAVIKDTIIVGDMKRSVITKHRSSDGALIDTVSVLTQPCFLAIDSQNRVVVSGWDGQHVDIVGVDGTTLFSIYPKIYSKNVKCCRGICCDSSAIYIAVCYEMGNEGHIHQYDTQGRFLSCIAQGLFCPGGISLISDGQQLAVADSKSVKIYNKV
ncbi:E3 ubiquitin-protein ligase TRIM56-like [Asterias amurensis]|uniref:E3 ubiquitin-protein ligase TRIM56-like n=1 Tax=Asterias amurensis TaxID=7602 RepID=UPI003AB1EA42